MANEGDNKLGARVTGLPDWPRHHTHTDLEDKRASPSSSTTARYLAFLCAMTADGARLLILLIGLKTKHKEAKKGN